MITDRSDIVDILHRLELRYELRHLAITAKKAKHKQLLSEIAYKTQELVVLREYHSQIDITDTVACHKVEIKCDLRVLSLENKKAKEEQLKKNIKQKRKNLRVLRRYIKQLKEDLRT